MEFLDFLTCPRLRVLWTLCPPTTSGSKHLEGNFHREGFNPATGSPTATLLRLHPSRRPHRGRTGHKHALRVGQGALPHARGREFKSPHDGIAYVLPFSGYAVKSTSGSEAGTCFLGLR
ncbi:hypothetical protein Tco_1536015 [Tanacetum coccineum]